MPGYQRKDELPLGSKKEQHGNTQESTRSGCHSNQPLVPAVAPCLLHPPSCSQGLSTQSLCTNCNLHLPSPLQGRLRPIAGYVLGGRGPLIGCSNVISSSSPSQSSTIRTAGPLRLLKPINVPNWAQGQELAGIYLGHLKHSHTDRMHTPTLATQSAKAINDTLLSKCLWD